MRKTTICILTLFLILIIQKESNAQTQKLHLVPTPQEAVFNESVFILNPEISVQIFMDNDETRSLIHEQIEKEFKTFFDDSFQLKEVNSGATLLIGVEGFSKKFDNIIKSRNLQLEDNLGKEGYEINISENEIVIASKTTKGAFYGVQTLKQLIRTNNSFSKLSGIHIKDWPDLEIRAMMDDISRGPVPTKQFMMEQIERMSELKINMLTYYTQDVVKTKSHPAFAPEGGAISIQEWKELADYAKKHYIDLVGNFQSFGHFDQILKHPEYAHLGESGMLLSPAFDESYELLEDIYAEMIPAFHSDYFHINSDETFDLGSGASKAMVDSLGKSVVYANHIKRIHKIITGMGKKVMMWGDIALDSPEILDMLPKDIIMITWGYDIMEDYEPRITPFHKKGFTLLVSTGILNSYSTMPDFNVVRGNIGGFMKESVKQNVWGMMNTVWDDGGFALFSRDWYGVAYAADQSWQSTYVDSTFDDRFNNAIYGTDDTGLTEAIHELNELANLKSTEKMNEDILWAKVIPDKGKSVLMNIQDWEKVNKIVEKAEVYLKNYKPTFYFNDIRYIQQIIDLYKYLSISRPNLVRSSELYKKAVSQQQQSNNLVARKYLVDSFDLLGEVYYELLKLKTENEFLWIQENRVYALDRVITKYDEQINAVDEAKSLLLQTIYEFDKGEKLPEAKEIRLDIQESKGWYFQGWLMCEAFPNKNGYKNPMVDYLEDMGGIESAFPNVTEEFYYNNVKYRWRRVNTPYFAKVDLDEIHKQSENVIGYAFAHIDIKEDRDVRALVGSSDGIEVFLNGKKVHQNFIEREFELDQDELILPLKEGRNHLMVRVTNKDGDWAFSFQLPDSEMRSYKNRYKIIE